jgi:AP-4 complex subunit mu-1
VNVVFNAAGTILHSEIIGGIVMKSFLTGQPELRLGLNEDLAIGRGSSGPVVLDYINFADFVNLTNFEQGRILSLFPPDGEFTVMNYRVIGKYDMPFRFYPYIEKHSPYKVEVNIKLRADIPKTSHGSNVLIRVPVPKTTQSVTVDFGMGSGSTYEYKSAEKCVLWGLKKLWGATEHAMRINISLGQPAGTDIEKHIGPISMKFEIPMHNVSGLNVRFLKIEERSKDYNRKS